MKERLTEATNTQTDSSAKLRKARAEWLADVLLIGAQMSNCCFNLSQGQKTLTSADRASLKALYERWDVVLTAEVRPKKRTVKR